MTTETTTTEEPIIGQKTKATFGDYLYLARIDHWFKNIFMIPGIVLALFYFKDIAIDAMLVLKITIGVLSTCFIASSNYIINEWLDRGFDRHHPTKKFRPAVTGLLKAKIIYPQYFAFMVVGLILASFINLEFFLVQVLLFVMGVFYNVRPFRTKEVIYLDVLSESVNNPIRLLLGWYILVETGIFPPISILISYWMGGAFLMACKRLAEYRFIDDPVRAGSYRSSFKRYNEPNLTVSIMFYACTAVAFLSIFLIKHRIELLLTLPFVALLFTWYLKITFQADSPTQKPEQLYRQYKFLFIIALLILSFVVMMFIDVPFLEYFNGIPEGLKPM